jgi:hypothetical protein
MPDFQYIYEHLFVEELDLIEPIQLEQMDLLIRVEAACAREIMAGIPGYGVARVVWKQDLLAWYHTSGGIVNLRSVKCDVLAVSRAA